MQPCGPCPCAQKKKKHLLVFGTRFKFRCGQRSACGIYEAKWEKSVVINTSMDPRLR